MVNDEHLCQKWPRVGATPLVIKSRASEALWSTISKDTGPNSSHTPMILFDLKNKCIKMAGYKTNANFPLLYEALPACQLTVYCS